MKRFTFKIVRWDEDNFFLFLTPLDNHGFLEGLKARFGQWPKNGLFVGGNGSLMECVVLKISKGGQWWSDKVSQSVICDENLGTDQDFALDLPTE